ncbi:hypothetical protein NCTGTJJY_CDS0208 [Serratia phage 92A1]|nr:hypothetical protein NCTGTJJY_CDS0208 [Serratia phage 92A1]
MSICVCCKQPIDEALVLETAKGPVHPGVCFNYVRDGELSEQEEQELNEVQLLV